MALVQCEGELLCCDEYLDHLLDEIEAELRPGRLMVKAKRFHEHSMAEYFKNRKSEDEPEPQHTVGDWERKFYIFMGYENWRSEG